MSSKPKKSKTKRRCDNCKITDVKLSKCSLCKSVRYCSVACQKQDRIRHVGECETLRSEREKKAVPVLLPSSSSSGQDVDTVEQTSSDTPCTNCGQCLPAHKLKECTCRNARYCPGGQCQKEHWKNHKPEHNMFLMALTTQSLTGTFVMVMDTSAKLWENFHQNEIDKQKMPPLTTVEQFNRILIKKKFHLHEEYGQGSWIDVQKEHCAWKPIKENACMVCSEMGCMEKNPLVSCTRCKVTAHHGCMVFDQCSMCEIWRCSNCDFACIDKSWWDECNCTKPYIEKCFCNRNMCEVCYDVHSLSGTCKEKPKVKSNKVKNNDPCPCGSGKKYKKCCKHL